MKKLVVLFSLFLAFHVHAQQCPLSSIVPSNDGNPLHLSLALNLPEMEVINFDMLLAQGSPNVRVIFNSPQYLSQYSTVFADSNLPNVVRTHYLYRMEFNNASGNNYPFLGGKIFMVLQAATIPGLGIFLYVHNIDLNNPWTILFRVASGAVSYNTTCLPGVSSDTLINNPLSVFSQTNLTDVRGQTFFGNKNHIDQLNNALIFLTDSYLNFSNQLIITESDNQKLIEKINANAITIRQAKRMVLRGLFLHKLDRDARNILKRALRVLRRKS